MVKQYTLLANSQRLELCRLVHEEGLTIKEAARRTGIPYPNAKAVNKTFERERRTIKKHHKFLEAGDRAHAECLIA
jgi:molybdenum-dependent DNA-binding transcriptional regulator ModE